MRKDIAANTIEIVPAILRRTWEGVVEDWRKVANLTPHIQIDITDGIFAGDGTFRDIRRFKQLPSSDKIELHMMVHTPGNFVDDIINLNPARCVFHVESFAGTDSLKHVYRKLRADTQTELGIAINPESPDAWLEENLDVADYVMFMGYNPGFAGQPINPIVYTKIGMFRGRHPDTPIAVDGGVGPDSVPRYVQAGARILAANSSIFKSGNPAQNIKHLSLLAHHALTGQPA